MSITEKNNIKSDIQEGLDKKVNLDYLYQTAKKGNAESMLKIAKLYYACARDAADYKNALEWAMKAKQHGKLEALFLLGNMYRLGLGCDKNRYLAGKYYRQLLRAEELEKQLDQNFIGKVYETYAAFLLERRTYRSKYLAKCFYKKALVYGLSDAQEKIDALTLQDFEETSERDYTVLYGIICVIVLGFTVHIIKTECAKPANHLVDSVIHKALTVKDADTVEAEGEMVTKGVKLLDEDVADYEKYHFVTEEELLQAGFSDCPVQEASATSEQVADVGAQYGIQNTYDGKLYTSWQEAEDDAGTGQSLMYSFNSQVTIQAMGIYPGNGRSEKAYAENNRPEMITLKAGTQELQCVFPDEKGMKYIVLDEPITCDEVTLTIDSVYQGKSLKNITCLTEIIFYQ